MLFSLLLTGYIEVLAAVEKQSIKRGSEGDVSLFAIENLLTSFRLPSIPASLLENLASRERSNKFIYLSLLTP